MAIEIPTNTALYIPVGPFLDKADGITPELSITVANSAITLIAGASDETAPTVVLDSVAGNNATNTLVHITGDDAGMHYLKLTAANNNRYGKGMLIIEDTDTYVTVFHEIQWVSVPYYNWKYGTTLPNVNVTQISGDSDAADNLELAYDGTGYAGGTVKPKVDLETIKTQAVTCGAGVTILASVGTAATSTAQTGDSFDKVNDATIGLANLKALIDAMQADIGDASASTLGSLYAILGNATAAIAGRLPAALESGNMPVHVKAQDNIDFGALQKASITAAVPTASAIGTDAASKVLVTPAQKLVTDANGYVTYSNAAPPSADDVRAAMEANGSKLDHLWEMTEDDGGTRRLTANALEEAPSGTGLDAAGVRAAIGMADADLDTQLAALPTAAENADAVWDEALSGHAGAGTAGAGLSAAGSAGDPWSTLLPGAYGAGTAGYLIGNLAPAGGSVWTYTVTLPDGTTPVADVIVRVCTDIAGTNVIRSSVTNSSGIATFYLQPGTYYIFCEKDGYNFSTYDTEVVS